MYEGNVFHGWDRWRDEKKTLHRWIYRWVGYLNNAVHVIHKWGCRLNIWLSRYVYTDWEYPPPTNSIKLFSFIWDDWGGARKYHIHPRSLTAKAPDKWWLEDDPFLLRPGNFSGGELLLNIGGYKNRQSTNTPVKTNMEHHETPKLVLWVDNFSFSFWDVFSNETMSVTLR